MRRVETAIPMLNIRTIDEGDEPLVFSFGRALDSGDLMLLGQGDRGSKPSPLVRLRARHHALARALANGMRPGVAAATYGYSASRVSILASDPAFKELVEHYRRETDFDYAQIQERLSGMTVEALDELERRLEDKPDTIATGILAKLVELGADRTGHGPKSSADVNVLVGFADRLQRARKRVESVPTLELEAEKEAMIEREPAADE